MDTPHGDTREKTVLVLLAAIQFAHVMDFMVMMPLGPQLMRIFSLSPAQFGHIVSAYGISSGIAGLLIAPFIDTFDRKFSLKVCLVGLFAGTLLCGLAPTHTILLLARCVAGFFGGVLGGLAQAVISDVFPVERRGFAISRVMSAFSIASILGVPVGLTLANAFGWHWPFLLVSVLLAALFVLAQLRFPTLTSHINAQSSLRQRVGQLTQLFTDTSAITGFTATFCIILGQFLVIPYISPYLVKNLGFSEKQLPLLYFLGGAASILTMPLIGRLTDKFGAAKVLPFGILISIAPLFTLTHLTTHNAVLILSVTTFFMVCMGGRMVPYSALLTTVVEPRKRGAYLSLNASVQSLAQGGAAYVASTLIHENAQGDLTGYTHSGWLAAVFSLITIGLGFKIAKNTQQRSALEESAIPTAVAQGPE